MAPNACSRDGFRIRDSARLPSVSPQDPGRNAYARVQRIRRDAATQAQGHASALPIEDPTVDGDNEQNVEEAEAAVLHEYEVIDLTEEVPSQQAQTNDQAPYWYRQASRRPSLEFSHRSRSVYKFGDIDLKLGTCVELREPFGKWEIQFVEIQSIWVSKTNGSVTIRGLPYTRNHSLRGAMENKRNEVCQVLEIDADDQRSDEAQASFEFSPQQILQVRTLNKTNAKFPRYCYGGEEQWLSKTPVEREEQAPLTCRWKFRIQYQDSRFRKHDRADAWAFIRMNEAEADGQFRVPDKENTAKWRGRTHRGGSHKPQVINLDGLEVPLTRNDRLYTYADVFCGAGGASRGAVMAGLKLVFGVDFWPVACATWRRNFPGARMCQQDVFDFINKCEINYRSHPIDILHLSPPCQFWSPLAYPHAGRNNEDNMAILFACPELIKKIRPRVFTLEQTFGLTHDAHSEFLNALIQGFTSHGYSVQWKIVPLVEYGLPQTRKRLIMMGACPGEPLPPWPPATHGAVPARGLKPFVTEAEAIRNLSGRRVTLHDVANALVRDLPPRSAKVPFPKTITCGGTQSTSHPSGRRDYTLREIACLQGFPIWHQFEGNKTAIKKQIGNAFPPCVVKAFYDHLRAWLQQVDGIQSVPAPASPPVQRETVSLVGRRRTNITARQKYVNGDLDEDEALSMALRESRRGPHPPASAAVIEISDDEIEQDSPVSAVAPLLGRMSIAPSDTQPDQRAESGPQDRSRSVTLDFSPSPTPGPGRRAAAAAQKRSLDSMHDGEADEVIKEASPPKRERVLEAGHREDGVVDDGRIPSRLPQYAGPQDTHHTNDEIIVISQPRRGSHGGARDSHGDRSPMGQRASHQGAGIANVAPKESGID